MPELPEVETVRRSLTPHLSGHVVVRATLKRRDIAVMPGDPEGGFSRTRAPRPRPRRVRTGDMLQGSDLAEPIRRGKQLALVTDDGPAIVVHLGMTGQLRWLRRGAQLRGQAGEHVHAVWRLDDGSRVVFRDPRRFGGLWLLPNRAELERRWAALGPDGLRAEPAELTAALASAFSGSVRTLKAALLDQNVIAGVGNIYADEALFRAGLHPARTTGSLRAADIDRLVAAVRTVLTAAVEARGSTLRDYTDADGMGGTAQLAHRVYGRAGQPCLVCGGPLSSAVIAQRTTVWCPACQPEP